MKQNRVRTFVDDDGLITLVDVHGYEIVTDSLSVEIPHRDQTQGQVGAIVEAKIPGVMVEQKSPRS